MEYKKECQECITTDCTELELFEEDNTWYCCNHSDYDPEDMCENCHVDYISTMADMYQDMVEDHLIHTEFDN